MNSSQVGDQSLPFKLGFQGDILVAGVWTSANQGILSVSFIDMTAGSEQYSVSTIVTVPTVMSQNEIRVVYADIDIDIVQGPIQSVSLTDPEVQTELDRANVEPPSETTVALGMSAWIITVDTKGTPSDLTDDEYIVAGGAQFVEA